ncbi:hypothetical protein KBD20_01410 [Candidatus Saccharibacteria bacterium]|nr:hypothetical protein [Candidatus Saccharibacteria bacterium]
MSRAENTDLGAIVGQNVREAIVNDAIGTEMLAQIVHKVRAVGVYTGVKRVLSDSTVDLNGYDTGTLSLVLDVSEDLVDEAIRSTVDRIASVTEACFRHSLELDSNN